MTTFKNPAIRSWRCFEKGFAPLAVLSQFMLAPAYHRLQKHGASILLCSMHGGPEKENIPHLPEKRPELRAGLVVDYKPNFRETESG